MTTRRKKTQGISRSGVNFVRTIVEAANCVFNEVEQSGDLGVDAYIEFVSQEEATGCCIAVQIKSGSSYRGRNGRLVLKAKRSHFEYWRDHSLPVCGIVFDPSRKIARWCDATAALEHEPQRAERGPFSLAAENEFSERSFARFQEHFMAYRSKYSADAGFGRSLERFTAISDPLTRQDALRALFSFHRNRAATWIYLSSLLRTVEHQDVLRLLVVALSHLPDTGDIAWGPKNEIETSAKLTGLMFMKLTFRRDDVVKLLSVVDEDGFIRGSIGQCAHAVLRTVRDLRSILESVAMDATLPDLTRQAAVWLFVFYMQEVSLEACFAFLDQYMRAAPNAAYAEAAAELAAGLREHGSIDIS